MIKQITEYALKAIEADTRQAQKDASWYDIAGAWCRALDEDFDLPENTAAGFVAALSPLNSWDSQLHYTPISLAACVELVRHGRRAQEGIRGPGFFSNKDKAARIIQGEGPLAVLGGDKVRAFYLNLIGDRKAVTIDRHAVKIAGWEKSLTTHAYNRIAQAYRFAGENLDLSGAEIQALTWSYYRRTDAAFSEANKRNGR